MKFNYQARTKKGDVHTGSVETSSKESAVTILRERGLYVTFLEEVAAPVYARRIEFFGKITKKDIVLFSRQLAIMFRSRVPLIESLRVLSIQTKNVDFKEKILKISEEVEGGTSFSQALARYPKIFSFFYVAMVKSGEASGKLSEVLNYLADHLEREYHLTAKARGALIYPCLVIVVALLVLTLLVFFVLPNLIEIFEASGQSFPTSTKIVIALADFFRSWWWLIFSLIILLILFFFKYRSTESGRNFFDRIILKIPILGLFLQMIYLARFAENLSTLISSGLPIVQALEIVGDIIGNVSYKEVILKIREEVKKGEMVSSTLSRAPELFPPVFIQMVLVGERTGTLDTTLMYIVDFYQKEVDRTIDNILGILEPALIVFLGFIVAGLMLSILMPLYQTIAL
ncbi:MAG: type II secretion system F family protein [Candidatus Nealsonbacteria bacterium]|nr:type II secretion system F family protein [Candidatus Nealsonbacteria bacterium]